MPVTATARILRASAAALAMATLLSGLTACTPDDGIGNGGHTAPASSPSASSQPSTSPEPPTTSAPATPTVAPPTPFAIDCADLVTLQQMYDYNANFVAAPDYEPAHGTPGATVLKNKGTVCGWVNETSKLTIAIAVARPSEQTIARLKDGAATDSHWVPTYGSGGNVEGYFTTRDGLGEAQVFTDGYWLVATSAVFPEPGATEPLVSDALGNLPKP